MEAKPITSTSFVNARDSNERLVVRQCNWGDPFQAGVTFDLLHGYEGHSVSLTKYEVKELHALLGRLLPAMR